MTDNPWLSQPAATPYPEVVEGLGMYWDSLANFIRTIDGRHSMGAGLLAERIAAEFMPPLLAEAERRGAERGWDEAHALRNEFWGKYRENPYRKPSSADLGAQEPVEVAGEGHDAQGGAE